MPNIAKNTCANGRAARDPTQHVTGRQGRLILVTSADSGRLDLLMQAVGRRMNGMARLAFVQPVVTRLLPAGGGAAVSRSAFGALDRAGALALVWQRDGRSFGHSVSLLARLATGETVVAGAPLEAEERAREIWPDTKIIRLETGTEGLRSGLSPRACLSRTVSGVDREPPPNPLLNDPFDVRLRDTGDIGAIIRALASAIVRQQPPALMDVPGKPPPQPTKAVLGETLARPKGAKRTRLATGAGLVARADKPQGRAVSST